MNALQKLLIGGVIAVPYTLIPVFWLLAPAERRQDAPGQPVETAAERKRAEWDEAHAVEYQETVDTYDARMSELENEAAKIAVEQQEATTKTEKEVLNEITDEIRRRFRKLQREKLEAEDALERTRDPRYVLKGHQSLISCVTFSPDSKRLASCAADNTVMVWDVGTGQPIRTLRGHKYMVWSVAYSPDGKRIVSVDWKKSLRIWDAETGEPLHETTEKSGQLMGIAFAPDGKTFATVKRLGAVQIRDASTGEVVKTFDTLAAFFPTVAFDPEGKRLFATMDLTSYWMWILEPKDDEPEPLFLGDQNRLSGPMGISPDGKLIATQTHGCVIAVKDIETGQLRCKLTGLTRIIRSLAFSRDGKWLASGSEDKTVRVWNVAERKQELLFADHTDDVWSVAFSPDGQWLASAGGDMLVRLRPLPKGDGQAK